MRPRLSSTCLPHSWRNPCSFNPVSSIERDARLEDLEAPTIADSVHVDRSLPVSAPLSGASRAHRRRELSSSRMHWTTA
jgi:hypothetical protein